MRIVTGAMATWHDAGKFVGGETRDLIRHVVERLPEYLLANAAVGRASMMIAVEEYLGQVFAEDIPSADWLRGLAVGSKQAIEDIALVAFSEEIAALASAPVSKCSTVALRGTQKEGCLIGHNEDYEPHYLGKMYVLDLRVGDEPRVVSLNYPGQLPHLAGALNEHGVVVTNNSMWPDAQPRLSNQVKLFRAVREKDAHDAVRRLWEPAGSLTSHYTVFGPGEKWRRHLFSIEVSNPESCVPRSKKYAEQGIYAESKEINGTFVHTNHARWLKLKKPDPAVLANNHSLGRYVKLDSLLHWKVEQAEDVGVEMTSDDLMELLSTNDGLVHRKPDQNATSVTLATLIISPEMPHTDERRFRVRMYDADGGHEDETITL